MFVSGDPLRSPGPQGEQLHDRSFLLWLNAQGQPCDITLPENAWVDAGEVVLSTDEAHQVGSHVKAGSVISLRPVSCSAPAVTGRLRGSYSKDQVRSSRLRVACQVTA